MNFYGRKKILLVKLDHIGDYVLFRTLLQTIRNCPKYKNTHITLLGNPIWREIAVTYDNDYVDEWMWLTNRDKCYRQRYEKLLPRCISTRRVHDEQEKVKVELRKRKFDEVMVLSVFRDEIVDWFIESLAPVVIGVKASCALPTDCIYTELVAIRRGSGRFVYDLNREYIEKVTESSAPPLSLSNPCPVEKRKGILVFVGASHPIKQMTARQYRVLIKRLLAETNEQIIVAGGRREASFVKRILKAVPSPRLSMIAGSQSLVEFIGTIQSARYVIANDTGPMHIAAASNIPTICTVNGICHEDAFWPYPDGRIKVILPRYSPKPLSPFWPVQLVQQKLAINSVSIDDVMKAVKELMMHYEC